MPCGKGSNKKKQINRTHIDVFIESSSKSDVTKESGTRFFWAEGKTKLQRMTGMTYIYKLTNISLNI